MSSYKKNYTQGYMTLHKNIKETSHRISYENYMQGHTLYAFDLTPDLCSADHFNLLKGGSLDKEQPKNVITMTTEFKLILIFVVLILYLIFCLKRVIKRKYFR